MHEIYPDVWQETLKESVYVEDRKEMRRNDKEIDCVDEGHRVDGSYSCSCPVVVDVQPSG
jgi:hypothetical protein